MARDREVCFTCGRPGNQAGHFIHRDCLDFDEIANHCQCVACNHFRSGNLAEYAIRLIDKYGRTEVDMVRARGNLIRKFGRETLEEIIKKYS